MSTRRFVPRDTWSTLLSPSWISFKMFWNLEVLVETTFCWKHHSQISRSRFGSHLCSPPPGITAFICLQKLLEILNLNECISKIRWALWLRALTITIILIKKGLNIIIWKYSYQNVKILMVSSRKGSNNQFSCWE